MAKNTVQKTASAEVRSIAKEPTSLISNQKLREIHAVMLKCRILGRRAESLFQEIRIAGDVHPSAGREGLAVAFVIDLRLEDLLSSSPGDWMSGFVKGAPIETIFQALAASAPDVAPLTAQDALTRWNILGPSATVREQLKRVCTAAGAMRESQDGRIAMAFFGDPSEARDPSREAIESAGNRKLPIVFIQQGCSDPPTATPKRARITAEDATICGVPVMVVDGNDAVALYRVACEAIARARQGRGPTLVESFSTDCSVSAAPDAACIYKGNENRPRRDPILTMESYLRSKLLFSEKMREQLIAEFSRELDSAIRFVSG